MAEPPRGSTSLPLVVAPAPVKGQVVKFLKTSHDDHSSSRTPSPTLYPPSSDVAKREINEMRADKLLEKYKSLPGETTLQNFLKTFVSIEEMNRMRLIASFHFEAAFSHMKQHLETPRIWDEIFKNECSLIFYEIAQKIFSKMATVVIQKMELEADLIKHQESRHGSFKGFVETLFLTTLHLENWMHATSLVVYRESYKLFARIEKETVFQTDELVPVDRKKHRYTNVLPFKDNVFKDVPASPMWLYGQLYIAMQAPLEADFDKFWELVYREDVATIVCLAEEKVDPYWENPESFSGIFIECQEKGAVVKEGPQEKIIRYVFNLYKNSNLKKTVTLYLYKGWPDMGVPRRLIHSLIDCTQEAEGPILVHCSAGTGRTGVFIAVDAQIRRIQNELKAGKTPDKISLSFAETAFRMRVNRPNMIRNRDQFAFIQRIVYERFRDDCKIPDRPLFAATCT